MGPEFHEQDYLACCGSTKFAKLMASSSPSPSYQHALKAARDVWFNKVDQRFLNRPMVEFEIAAQEQMKITELRLAKLFQTSSEAALPKGLYQTVEERVSVIGGHLTATPEAPKEIKSETSPRTRPPITTHVLDISRGCPASGIEVRLEKWSGNLPRPLFEEADVGGWALQRSSITDNDGRSGQLMGIVDSVKPGIYKISFNTGKYCEGGFFPYVSIVFEIKESQKLEHFHVPLLLSPFAFSTYRGS